MPHIHMIPRHAEICKGRFHALTNEELALQVQAENPAAFDELAQQSRRVIHRCAWRLWLTVGGDMNPLGAEYDDMAQIALMGLYGACLAYDPAKGFRLLSYLWRQMQTAFRDQYRDHRNDALKEAVSGDVPIGEDNDATRLDTIVDDSAAAAFEDSEDTDYWQQVRGVIGEAL